MTRRSRHRGSRERAAVYLTTDKASLALLDTYAGKDIDRFKKISRKLLDFHRQYFYALASQRDRVIAELKDSLAESAINDFPFENWQRLVKYRWSDQPLSAKGSLLSEGQRFNIGDIEPSTFPPFPALYIASDKETAILETLGASNAPQCKLTPYEQSLTNSASVSLISLSGKIDTVLDITNEKALQPFCNIVRNFQIPSKLKEAALKLKLPPPRVIQVVDELLQTLLEPNWRFQPMQLDVPSNSQIFGQLVMSAGIEGIVYPSVKSGKKCIAIFPTNFEKSSSWVKISDSVPAFVKIAALDMSTWRECV